MLLMTVWSNERISNGYKEREEKVFNFVKKKKTKEREREG